MILTATPQLGLAEWTPEPGADPSGNTDEVIDHYLKATSDMAVPAHGASMEVDINASVPKLKEEGKLHALRLISQVGRVSYRVLGFQGSNTVKSQVIARYLQAEQQGQANAKFAITPANYHFHLKYLRRGPAGSDVYVVALNPHKSAAGLFKGEMWLDSKTFLPVYEKGRLVKNPSIFFRRVDFERNFSIRDGQAIPQHMNSVITTRLVGKVELEVNYTHFSEMGGDAAESADSVRAVRANFAQ